MQPCYHEVVKRKTFTLDEVRHLLATNEAWTRRAVIRLYQRQTLNEQAAKTTRNANGVGFQPGDALWFSRLAQYAIKYPNRRFTEKQLAILRKSWRGAPAICKYAGQVLDMIENSSNSAPSVNTNTVCTQCGDNTKPCRCEYKAQYAVEEQFAEMLAAFASMR